MKMLQAQWSNLLSTKGPSQADFDAKIEKGASVQVNPYMLDILSSLQKMHKVLATSMETQQLQNIFKEAFRVLVVEIENFFAGIKTDSKFSKVRIRVDLTQTQNVIAGLQFESNDVSELAEQKIKGLINTKCGVKVEDS